MKDFFNIPISKKLFVLTILLRVIIMPFFFHPDIKNHYFHASFLSKGVFNIYTYLSENKKDLPVKEDFNYFPITYFLLGGYKIIVNPLLGSNFSDWVKDTSQVFVQNPYVFRYLFILKFPYLLLDILTGFLILKFFKKRVNQKKAFLYWFFNPFTLVLIYIFSNLDIITVFLSLLSVCLFQRRRSILSAITLGFAVSIKIYPLMILPFYLIKEKDFSKRLLLSIFSILTVGVTVIPFLSNDFKNTALVSGLSTRIFSPGISLGFGENLMIPVILLSILFGFLLSNSNKLSLVGSLSALFLLIYSSVHFHIQWLLWVAPFLIINSVKIPRLKWLTVFIALISILIPILYNDKSMSVSLLRVISINYNYLPIPFAIVQKFYDPYLVQGILHSMLFGLSIMYIFNLVKNHD